MTDPRQAIATEGCSQVADLGCLPTFCGEAGCTVDTIWRLVSAKALGCFPVQSRIANPRERSVQSIDHFRRDWIIDAAAQLPL